MCRINTSKIVVNREFLVPLLFIYHAKCADRMLLRYRVFCKENPLFLYPSIHPSLHPQGNKLKIKNRWAGDVARPILTLINKWLALVNTILTQPTLAEQDILFVVSTSHSASDIMFLTAKCWCEPLLPLCRTTSLCLKYHVLPWGYLDCSSTEICSNDSQGPHEQK